MAERDDFPERLSARGLPLHVEKEIRNFLSSYAKGENLDAPPGGKLPGFFQYIDFLRPPAPPDESERLKKLRSYRTRWEPTQELRQKLCTVADLAASALNANTALVVLIEEDVVRISGVNQRGIPESLPRSHSACAHVALRRSSKALCVPNLSEDQRFARNPLLCDALGIRFYAGVPLRTSDGYNIGVMCVVNSEPQRKFDKAAEAQLKDFADIAVGALELHRKTVEAELRAKLREIVSSFTAKSQHADNIKEIFQRFCTGVARLLETEVVFLLEVLPGFALRVRWQTGLRGVGEESGFVSPRRFAKELIEAKMHHGICSLIWHPDGSCQLQPPVAVDLSSVLKFKEDAKASTPVEEITGLDLQSLSDSNAAVGVRPERSYYVAGAYTRERENIMEKQETELLLNVCASLNEAIALYEARENGRLALKEIQEEKRSLNTLLENVLPVFCLDALKKGARNIVSAIPCCTIIFVDIVKFTKICGELPPEDVVLILNRVFSRFDILAKKMGIEKIKTIGDCYVAAAGCPDTREDHAKVAADFALAALVAVENYNERHTPQVEIRMGLQSGPVTCGVLAIAKTTFDCWGPTVSKAQQLQESSNPNKINVSRETYCLLENGFRFTYRGVLPLESGPTPMYFLDGPRENETEAASSVRRELDGFKTPDMNVKNKHRRDEFIRR